MRTSDIEDSNGTLIKEGDNISFIYEDKATIAIVKYNNGGFIIECPKHQPFSCTLLALKDYVSVYTITP